MKRYQVQDPTGQGFWWVVDTRDWKPVRIWKLKPLPHFRRSHTGNTYMVASFTPYCPDARRLADELAEYCNRVAGYSTAPAPGPILGDIHIMSHGTDRTISVAVISGKWCPYAAGQAEHMKHRLSIIGPAAMYYDTQIIEADE